METIYVFNDGKDVYGFCKSEDGQELPKEHDGVKVSWKPFKTLQIQDSEKNRIALDVQEMKAAIEKDGYYINKAEVISKIYEE